MLLPPRCTPPLSPYAARPSSRQASRYSLTSLLNRFVKMAPPHGAGCIRCSRCGTGLRGAGRTGRHARRCTLPPTGGAGLPVRTPDRGNSGQLIIAPISPGSPNSSGPIFGSTMQRQSLSKSMTCGACSFRHTFFPRCSSTRSEVTLSGIEPPRSRTSYSAPSQSSLIAPYSCLRMSLRARSTPLPDRLPLRPSHRLSS